MRTPELNPSGYANSSVLSRAEGFAKIKYLLAHGTGTLTGAVRLASVGNDRMLCRVCRVCVVRVSYVCVSCDLADDNVHLQNAAELSKVLVRQGIDFEQMYYTNCILFPPALLPLFQFYACRVVCVSCVSCRACRVVSIMVDASLTTRAQADHSINADNARRHLYHLLSRFVIDNL
jgi:hypothetical protein